MLDREGARCDLMSSTKHTQVLRFQGLLGLAQAYTDFVVAMWYLSSTPNFPATSYRSQLVEDIKGSIMSHERNKWSTTKNSTVYQTSALKTHKTFRRGNLHCSIFFSVLLSYTMLSNHQKGTTIATTTIAMTNGMILTCAKFNS